MKFIVAAQIDGWAVARQTATGRLVAVSDHPTRESAESMCRRLNRQYEAAEAQRQGNAQLMDLAAERSRAMASAYMVARFPA